MCSICGVNNVRLNLHTARPFTCFHHATVGGSKTSVVAQVQHTTRRQRNDTSSPTVDHGTIGLSGACFFTRQHRGFSQTPPQARTKRIYDRLGKSRRGFAANHPPDDRETRLHATSIIIAGRSLTGSDLAGNLVSRSGGGRNMVIIMIIIIRTLLPRFDDKGEVRPEAVSRSSPPVHYVFYRPAARIERKRGPKAGTRRN